MGCGHQRGSGSGKRRQACRSGWIGRLCHCCLFHHHAQPAPAITGLASNVMDPSPLELPSAGRLPAIDPEGNPVYQILAERAGHQGWYGRWCGTGPCRPQLDLVHLPGRCWSQPHPGSGDGRDCIPAPWDGMTTQGHSSPCCAQPAPCSTIPKAG